MRQHHKKNRYRAQPLDVGSMREAASPMPRGILIRRNSAHAQFQEFAENASPSPSLKKLSGRKDSSGETTAVATQPPPDGECTLPQRHAMPRPGPREALESPLLLSRPTP